MPRHCAVIDLPFSDAAGGSVRGFVCGDGIQRCQEPGCGFLSEALCDFPVSATKTCDRRLCAHHRRTQPPRPGAAPTDADGDTVDFCPAHHAQAQQSATKPGWERAARASRERGVFCRDERHRVTDYVFREEQYATEDGTGKIVDKIACGLCWPAARNPTTKRGQKSGPPAKEATTDEPALSFLPAAPVGAAGADCSPEQRTPTAVAGAHGAVPAGRAVAAGDDLSSEPSPGRRYTGQVTRTWWGWSVRRNLVTGRCEVRDPAGTLVATHRRHWSAMTWALAQRPGAAAEDAAGKDS